MALRIEDNRRVSLAYRLTDSGGRLLEDRTPENPFEYTQGQGQVLPAIERIVQGKTAGFRADVQVSPREAYGDYDPKLVIEMERSRFPKNVEIYMGMKFNTTGPQGKPITVRVVEIADQMITIDGNHPLAGLELIFELRVLDVRESEGIESEMDDGGPGVGNLDEEFDDEQRPGREHSRRGSGSLH